MKIYRKLIFSTVLCLCSSLLASQAYTWTETEFTIPNEEATEAVKIRTFDGGDLICANTHDGSWMNTFMYLIKLDTAGNIAWTQRYAINIAVQQIIQCPDSSIIVCGEDGINWTGYKLIKLDQDGNILYSKQLIAPGHPTMSPPVMLARNNNNVYFGATVVDSIDFRWHWHTFEIDPSGNVVSSHVYHSDSLTIELVALDTFSNGDLFLVGGWVNPALPLTAMCALVDRVNSSGNIVWSKRFSASTSAFRPQCIEKAGTDKFIVSTHYLRPVPFGYTGGMTYIKLDGAGNVLWSYRYEDYVVQFGEIVTLPNAETCVIGGDMGYKTFMLRLDSVGNLLQTSCYNWRYFSTLNKVPGGYFSMCGINYNNRKIVIEKTSPFGESCIDSTYTFVQGGFSVISTPDSGSYPLPMQVYTATFPFTSPVIQKSVVCSTVDIAENPVPDNQFNVINTGTGLHISCGEVMYRVEIFDASGRLVYATDENAEQIVVSTDGLSSGVFVVNVVCANSTRSSKFTISH